ncbi:putative two-component system sensor kinase [Carbonactinospora thermoautotrophica]|nr:DUF5931 domain-containing protein [Carbonactinospora thermoautotrophica]KWX01657.1 putative two-component system sensor kinase [Carbonactinospora thermoautotrophica]
MVEGSLFRALGIYRVLTFCYAVVTYLREADHYRHPGLGWAVICLIGGWTVVTIWVYRRPRRRNWWMLGADLAFACAAMMSTRWLDDPAMVARGEPTITTIWVSSAVIAWAIKGGWRLGVVGALVLSAAATAERGALTGDTLHNNVLVLLAGLTVGYLVELARKGERAMSHALQIEVATRIRDVLAREIHDNVLQVLALVQRRGAEIGGEAAELGRLAGEQEAALRALVSSGWDADSLIGAAPPDRSRQRQHPGTVDLRGLLRAYSSPRVTVAAPGTPVEVSPRQARELAAAVGAALDNVRNHAGPNAHAWILLEDEPDRVVITVRDNGSGIPPGRLEDAAAEGRLGVAQSIQGRLRDLGGEAVITSAPGQGTEVELRLPRSVRVTT